MLGPRRVFATACESSSLDVSVFDEVSLVCVQVNPQCDCQHQTAGVNCERCADLYNDLPWRPAEEGDTHTCQRKTSSTHCHYCTFYHCLHGHAGQLTSCVCHLVLTTTAHFVHRIYNSELAYSRAGQTFSLAGPQWVLQCVGGG